MVKLVNSFKMNGINRGLLLWIIILFYNLLLIIVRLLVPGGSPDPE